MIFDRFLCPSGCRRISSASVSQGNLVPFRLNAARRTPRKIFNFALAPAMSRYTLLHDHVQTVLQAMRRLGLPRLIDSRPSRKRDLVVAMIAARILEPNSKLATTRWWSTTTFPAELDVEDADEPGLYAALDWLLKRQERIEKKLAASHLD